MYEGICASLNPFFFHLDEKLKISLVELNLRSVTEVVKFIKVLNGLASIVLSAPTLNKLTVPLLEPVANSCPLGLKASVVELKEPSSGVLDKHFYMRKSN